MPIFNTDKRNVIPSMHTSPDGSESPYKRLGTRFCVHIVFVASAASNNVNEKIKTQTSSTPFVGGYMGAASKIFKQGGLQLGPNKLSALAPFLR